ncbi:branched-chain amino acid ABC transporter permease [Bradyrhizobium sp. 14AA]
MKIVCLLCLVLALAWPTIADEQWLTVGAFVAVASIAAISLQVLTGFTGLISLGHAAFLGIGAYVASALGPGVHTNVDLLIGEVPFPLALLIGNKEGWPLCLGLVLSGSCAALIGLVVAPIATRLSGIYLAIVTIGLVFAAQYLFINWTWLTGGNQGVQLSAPSVGNFSFETSTVVAGLTFSRTTKLYYLSMVIAALTALAVKRLKHSKTGRALRAIRDNPTAAAASGINVNRCKIIAFSISSFIAGVSGALYGSQYGFALPETWDLNFSVMLMAMLVIGGIGLVRGAVLGAVFVTVLPPILRNVFGGDLSLLGFNAPQLNNLIFGAAIMVFLIVAPGGLARLPYFVRPPAPARQTPTAELKNVRLTA